jgi:hypothetical protein
VTDLKCVTPVMASAKTEHDSDECSLGHTMDRLAKLQREEDRRMYQSRVVYATSVLLLCGALLLGGTTAVAFESSSHRVKAVMMLRESTIRTTLANQDTYRVRVTPKSGRAFEALIVDSFPSYGETLPPALQSEGAVFFVRLRRTPYCDREASGTEVPLTRCFAMEHGSWRAAEHTPVDEWWK